MIRRLVTLANTLERVGATNDAAKRKATTTRPVATPVRERSLPTVRLTLIVVLRKGGEKFLVQCKQWKAFNVGVQTVREFYGVMAAEHASGPQTTPLLDLTSASNLK